MRRISFLGVLLALASGLLVGCATLGSPSRVSVNVVDVRPSQATLLETTAVLTLRFTNESPDALQLKGSTHRLYLNGSSVGRGVDNTTVTVPALGTVTQTVTLYLENLTLARKAAEFSRAPNAIDYRLESELFTVNGSVRATSTGQLDVSGLMSAFPR